MKAVINGSAGGISSGWQTGDWQGAMTDSLRSGAAGYITQQAGFSGALANSSNLLLRNMMGSGEGLNWGAIASNDAVGDLVSYYGSRLFMDANEKAADDERREKGAKDPFEQLEMAVGGIFLSKDEGTGSIIDRIKADFGKAEGDFANAAAFGERTGNWFTGAGFGTDDELKQQALSNVFASGNMGIEVVESDFIDKTDMTKYAKRVEAYYGTNAMDDLLKVNGCSTVEELEAKVRAGEKIFEPKASSWNSNIQSVYDKEKQEREAKNQIPDNRALTDDEKIAIMENDFYNNVPFMETIKKVNPEFNKMTAEEYELYKQGKYRYSELKSGTYPEENKELFKLGEKTYKVASISYGALGAIGSASIGGEIQFTVITEERNVIFAGRETRFDWPTDIACGLFFVDKSGIGKTNFNPNDGPNKYESVNGSVSDDRFRNPQNAVGYDIGWNISHGHTKGIEDMDGAINAFLGYTNIQDVGYEKMPISLNTFQTPTLWTEGKGWYGGSIGLKGKINYIGIGQTYTYDLIMWGKHDKK